MTDDLARTRNTLQRIAVHVLARARWAHTERFGLRVVPGGIATPAFGPDSEVVRIAGALLVREMRVDGEARTVVRRIEGASLRDLAAVAGVSLDPAFSVGHDTPPLGDLDAPLVLSPANAEHLWAWFEIAARALDRFVLPVGAPSVVQLWPEHFDVAIDTDTASGRANVGASAGDGYCSEPYVYVGPWGPERPGDSAFWNAPFGATLGESAVRSTGDALGAIGGFFGRGLDQLGVAGSGP